MEARRLSFPSIFGVEKPSKDRSTMKPRIVPSSFAHTTARSAMGELVIHIFAPLRIKPPSTGLAFVTMEDGSEP